MMMNLLCLMVSCTNFFRPTCSYTECQLSFLTGSCPTERTTASYSSCFQLIFTDLLPPRDWLLSGCSPLFIGWSCWDVVHFTPHLGLRVSFPKPCPISDPSGVRQGSGILMQSIVLMVPALSVDSVLQYHPTFSSDHILSPWLVLCKSPSIFYKLLQSVAASFSADYLFWSCSTHGAA